MASVLLVFNAGMSTVILARKMEAMRPDSLKVSACPSGDYAARAADADILMIGPQIRFRADEIRCNVTIPVMVIETRKYGMMDAKGILEDMDKLLKG